MKMKKFKMLFIPVILVCLGITLVLFTMGVPRYEGDWEINEINITDSPHQVKFPCLVWNGSGYGITWEDLREGDPKLFFAMLDSEGNMISETKISDTPIGSFASSLVWTGEEYAVAWTQTVPSNTIYFARINSAGIVIDEELVVSSGTRPSLVWTGTEYGIAWTASGSIMFSRITIDGDGNLEINDPVTIAERDRGADFTSLVWNSRDREYGIAWMDIRDGHWEIYFAKTNEYGSKFDLSGDGVIDGRDDVRITTYPGNSLYPSLVWTGGEYGVAWHDTMTPTGIYFARIGSDGTKIGDDVRISYGSQQSLVWTGRGYGVINGYLAFTDFKVDGDGNIVTEDMIHVTGEERGRTGFPSLVWTGTEYGVAWHDFRDVNEDIFFATIRNVAVPETGRFPSIYRNKMVYQRGNPGTGWDVYMYDFIDREETRINSRLAGHFPYPRIYGDTIVWQEPIGVPTGANICMYNIETGVEDVIAGGGTMPKVHGDYIIWDSSGGGSHDIGIYRISSGTTELLSSRISSSGNIYFSDQGEYEISGNIIAYCKRRVDLDAVGGHTTDVYIYNMETGTEEMIASGSAHQRVYALNGEYLMYTETVPEFVPGSDAIEYRESLKSYNLITEDHEDMATGEPDDFTTIHGNSISGDRLLYLHGLLDEYRGGEEVGGGGLWLYGMGIPLDSSCRCNNTGGFDIWGNRIVYSHNGRLRLVVLEDDDTPNTPEGSNISVPLGDGSITVEFSNVGQSGETVLERSTAGGYGGEYEGQFELVNGDETVFYNITTSAETVGATSIEINYETLLGITAAEAEALNLYHWDQTLDPAEWVELERDDIDYDNNTVTFVTESLSPLVFGYALRNDPPSLVINPSSLTLILGDRAFAYVRADDPNGDPVSVSIDTSLERVFFRNNRFYWRSNQLGTHEVIFTASDGDLYVSKMLTIKVIPGVEIISPEEAKIVCGIIPVTISVENLNRPFYVILYANNRPRAFRFLWGRRSRRVVTLRCNTRRERNRDIALTARVYDLSRRRGYRSLPVRVHVEN